MFTKTEIGLTNRLSQSVEKDLDAVTLLNQFEELIDLKRISWSTSLQLCELIGAGSQGKVFRGQRIGSDGFQLPVAVKYFSPEIHASADSYDRAMAMIGKIASLVAIIQHENLLVVNHFLNQDRIRVMVMEWIDGFDLRKLLTARKYGSVQERCSLRRWAMLNERLFRPGPVQPRLRINAAMSILSDCLSALSAMHDEGILHNDLKPSNIMLDRAGRAKVIDIGSASLVDEPVQLRTFTPAYSAPEVLSGEEPARVPSDIASLGYVALEMLTGRPLTSDQHQLPDLLQQKLTLSSQIPSLLADELGPADELISFFKKLTSAKQRDRYQTADEALADCQEFIRRYQFDSDTRSCIRIWISELLDRE